MDKSIKIYEDWLRSDFFDSEFKKELSSIGGDLDEIEDRFFKDLEFGTAGMRGVVGAGRNRFNKYTVRKATQGFATFLTRRAKDLGHEKKIAIAYDSRNSSKRFAEEVASVFAGNGFTVLIYGGVRTTPQLSFTIRHTGSLGGVVLTASHNPPEYNGYKVYDENGCQLITALSDILIEDVNAIQDFSKVLYLPFNHGLDTGLIQYIGGEIDAAYIDMLKSVSLRPEIVPNSRLKIVFTPLHGAAGDTAIKMFDAIGKDSVIRVDTQMEPDGDFPTIKTPNPETPAAFEEAKKYMRRSHGDIAMATDPDGDRFGLMTKRGNIIGGNELGALFLDYVLSTRNEKGLQGENDYVITTVVSSDIADSICEHYGVKCIKTLTGFKHMGDIIKDDPENFVMAYEESYGFLFSPEVRDKDGIMAIMIAVEMAIHNNNNLENALRKLDGTHGVFLTETVSTFYRGSEGLEEMAEIMEKLRSADLGQKTKIDYLLDDTGIPKSNVLKFIFDNKTWVALRPSGTEPKLKVYYCVWDSKKEGTETKLANLKAITGKFL